MNADPVIMAIFIEAIASVEGNPHGYADNGLSYGPLCITRDCMADVNRRFRTHYVWPKDAGDWRKASDIFVKYTSRTKSFGEAASMWNAGAHGKNRKRAKIYSAKVLRIFSNDLTNRVGRR